ncbi:receptor homology region, transmembrane domain- and RING domain-containing protein 1-like [Phaseolus vulgaris]|uniref:receptor homology region, transmembrane domain- and RING domain-containing protein 1-like n=1 Tax=Phaseolus vulgaris TaxID=3885 RepID=UPI0035CC633F
MDGPVISDPGVGGLAFHNGVEGCKEVLVEGAEWPLQMQYVAFPVLAVREFKAEAKGVKHREQDEDFEVVEVLLAAIGVREFNHQYLADLPPQHSPQHGLLRHKRSARSPTNLNKGFLAPAIAYILFAIFGIIFFMGLIFMYFPRHSSSLDPEFDDIHGKPSSRSPTVVAETAGECTICLEEVGEGEMVKMIAYCNHIFHADCIERWLENQVTAMHSSSLDPESDDIHEQPSSRSPTVVTEVAETAGECTICFEEVGEGETMKMIAYCNHIFHTDCIERWLENQVIAPSAGNLREVKRWSW